MIDGNPNEFIEGLHYGDERFFILDGVKYLVQGYSVNGKPTIILYALSPEDKCFDWEVSSNDNNYPVEEFEKAKIFNGKSFWEVEKDIQWVDD